MLALRSVVLTAITLLSWAPPATAAMPLPQQKAAAEVDLVFYKQNIGSPATEAAIAALERAAKADHRAAQVEMGRIYERGHHLTKDLAQAKQWYQRAGNSGEFLWLHDIGCYFLGHGSLIEIEQTTQFILRLADKNNLNAQITAAQIYDIGLGIAQSRVQSDYWHSRALITVIDRLDPIAVEYRPADKQRDPAYVDYLMGRVCWVSFEEPSTDYKIREFLAPQP